MPNTAEWMTIAERFGVPVASMVTMGAFVAFAVYRVGKFVATKILEPAVQQHFKFVDALIADQKVNTELQVRQAASLSVIEQTQRQLVEVSKTQTQAIQEHHRLTEQMGRGSHGDIDLGPAS